jgi:alcohol dehydrogenase class IV
MKFQYNLPVNLIFGRGQVSQLGLQTAKYGKRALLVTGRGSTRKSGLLDKASALLREAGVTPVVFDRVDQNPLTDIAYMGAGVAAENGCDVVVGLGGGSIMDAAKAIAFVSENEGDISDYIFGRKTSDAALPILLVPTTCGTGSEGNGFAVLTNPETHDKKSLRCTAIVAKASIIDPELMTTMPKAILAAVGFDALCHNMEAYLSRIGQPLTDMMALEGIRLSGVYLTRAYNDYSDDAAWDAVTWASTLGGMTINTAGVTAPHGLEHPASGLRDIVHGLGLAALTPVIIEESVAGAPGKYAAISRFLGGKNEYDCADTIRELLAALSLTTTLGAQGIREEDVDWMAENCLKVSAAGLANHPVVFGLEDIKRIYKKAL